MNSHEQMQFSLGAMGSFSEVVTYYIKPEQIVDGRTVHAVAASERFLEPGYDRNITLVYGNGLGVQYLGYAATQLIDRLSRERHE